MKVKIEEGAEEELSAVGLRLDQVLWGEGYGAPYSRQKLPKFDEQIHDPNRVHVVFGVFEMLQSLEFHLLLIVPAGDSKDKDTISTTDCIFRLGYLAYLRMSIKRRI